MTQLLQSTAMPIGVQPLQAATEVSATCDLEPSPDVSLIPAHWTHSQLRLNELHTSYASFEPVNQASGRNWCSEPTPATAAIAHALNKTATDICEQGFRWVEFSSAQKNSRFVQSLEFATTKAGHEVAFLAALFSALAPFQNVCSDPAWRNTTRIHQEFDAWTVSSVSQIAPSLPSTGPVDCGVFKADPLPASKGLVTSALYQLMQLSTQELAAMTRSQLAAVLADALRPLWTEWVVSPGASTCVQDIFDWLHEVDDGSQLQSELLKTIAVSASDSLRTIVLQEASGATPTHSTVGPGCSPLNGLLSTDDDDFVAISSAITETPAFLDPPLAPAVETLFGDGACGRAAAAVQFSSEADATCMPYAGTGTTPCGGISTSMSERFAALYNDTIRTLLPAMVDRNCEVTSEPEMEAVDCSDLLQWVATTPGRLILQAIHQQALLGFTSSDRESLPCGYLSTVLRQANVTTQSRRALLHRYQPHFPALHFEAQLPVLAPVLDTSQCLRITSSDGVGCNVPSPGYCTRVSAGRDCNAACDAPFDQSSCQQTTPGVSRGYLRGMAPESERYSTLWAGPGQELTQSEGLLRAFSAGGAGPVRPANISRTAAWFMRTLPETDPPTDLGDLFSESGCNSA